MLRALGVMLTASLLSFAVSVPAVSAPEDGAAQMLYEKGRVLFEAKRFEDARRKLDAAFRLSPNDRSRLMLARTLVALDRCGDALPFLRGVRVEGLPKGERASSRQQLTVALDKCGGSIEQEKAAALLVARARDRLGVKQFGPARHDLEIARKLAPGDRVLYWLGYVYEASGNCAAALRLFKRLDLDNLPADERASAEKRIQEGTASCSRPPLDMVFIPAGRFEMGSARGEADERPVHSVELPAFLIDRTEVTVVHYAACVKEGACPRSTYLTHDEKPYCNLGNAQRDQHPMNCVSWEGAAAYCEWAGKRLPTEAEWERSARGNDGRTYPWGEELPSCSLGIMKEAGTDGCGQDRTWVIASRPRGVSEFGLFDVAGNVWEWVQDWYGPDYYRDAPASDPKGPRQGEQRVMRGGSWLSDDVSHSLRSANRDHELPTYRGNGVGFRCARRLTGSALGS